MSETTGLSERDTFTFKHALELVRKCWLPLLITVILVFLPSVAAMVITWEGEAVALAAQEASVAKFDDPPSTPTSWVTQITAERATQEAYDAAFRPYSLAALGAELIGWVYTPWLTLRLYNGLLEALRGGKCTLRCLVSARSRWKTALWLNILTALFTGGAALAGTVLIAGLSAVLSVIGSIIGLIVFVVGMYWVELHLLVTESHLADDADVELTATDCIRYSWRDMKEYGLFSALCVVWPMLLVQEFFSLMGDFVSASHALDVVHLLAQMLCTALTYAACAGIYDEIRHTPEAGASNGASADGLARARALASGEDSAK